MNDFFLHLAARSFDHAGDHSGGIELVRPRLPSLFESAPEKPHDFAEFFTGSARNEVFDNRKEDSLRSMDSRAPVQVNLDFKSRIDPYGRPARLLEDGERSPFYSVGAITATEDQAAPIESDPVFQTRVQFESREDDPVQSRHKALELSISQPPLRSEMPGRLAEEMKLSSMSATPDKGSGQDEDPGVVRQLLAERPENPPKQVAVIPVLVENVQLIESIQRMVDRELPPGKKENENRELGMARSVFQPIGTVFHTRKKMALRKAVSQPEPTINVTIGRIEVRAVTASKVEKRKAAPSAMSLDEYLARRTGGRS